MKSILPQLKRKLLKTLKKDFSRLSFTSSIPPDISILEIGPFYNPVCVGSKVEYFDILSQNDLKTRAKEIDDKVDLTQIPFINYVSSTGDLDIIKKRFDAVISCHAIEHQLDLIGHFQSVSKLLEAGGNYYLIVPDKRYCFDHYMAESTIAEVIGFFHEKKYKHSLKSVIEHRALTTHNFAEKHWMGNHGSVENVASIISMAIKEFDEAKDGSLDVHGWYFTPDSFLNIVNLLKKLKYINFSVKELVPTQYENFEFYVVLELNPE